MLMARDDDRTTGKDDLPRDKYRDNDDVRAPLEGDARTGGNPDTKSEARGDARENVGNTARGADTNIRGAEWNDNTRGRPRPDQFDSTLRRDNERR
jgi:hypothetical protein